MKLVMVRHGESMGNVDPTAYKDDNRNFLSPHGEIQAQLCGSFLRKNNHTFDRVISSNLTRARQTTLILLRYLAPDAAHHWENQPRYNELFGNALLDEAGPRAQIAQGIQEIIAGTGSVLLVSHYYVMQEIFNALPVLPRNIASHGGKHVPNAVPFVWDSSDRDHVRMIDVTNHTAQF